MLQFSIKTDPTNVLLGNGGIGVGRASTESNGARFANGPGVYNAAVLRRNRPYRPSWSVSLRTRPFLPQLSSDGEQTWYGQRDGNKFHDCHHTDPLPVDSPRLDFTVRVFRLSLGQRHSLPSIALVFPASISSLHPPIALTRNLMGHD
ncbi:hypothetical protein VUR80DRAFT_207 [Thermomyces stellatus]